MDINSRAPHPVIFMTPSGPRTMSFMHKPSGDMCKVATQLKATHWICQDGVTGKGVPIWALFELRKCNPDGGGPRVWSLGLPTKTWTLPNIDPLWMWAMHREAARKE